MRRSASLAAIALLAGISCALPTHARCVRDVAESGAVGVRCSDGVRGRLSTDDVAPANPTLTFRNGSLSSRNNTRNENASALPAAKDQSLYQFRPGGEPSGRSGGDSAAGALSRSRNMGVGSALDPQPQR